jgi:hypothetical protein
MRDAIFFSYENMFGKILGFNSMHGNKHFCFFKRKLIYFLFFEFFKFSIFLESFGENRVF